MAAQDRLVGRYEARSASNPLDVVVGLRISASTLLDGRDIARALRARGAVTAVVPLTGGREFDVVVYNRFDLDALRAVQCALARGCSHGPARVTLHTVADRRAAKARTAHMQLVAGGSPLQAPA